MILEGIVTTVSDDGSVNIAPMGPHVDDRMDHLVLHPYRTSQTYQNLKTHGEGVLHVTDDVLLLAQAALGCINPYPALAPATVVRGYYLRDACRYYEFRLTKFDDREERTWLEAKVVHQATLREFFGFNRAKHAVLEAAILATRTDFLPLQEIQQEYCKLAIPIQKTGGQAEKQAFALLTDHLARVTAARNPQQGSLP